MVSIDSTPADVDFLTPASIVLKYNTDYIIKDTARPLSREHHHLLLSGLISQHESIRAEARFEIGELDVDERVALGQSLYTMLPSERPRLVREFRPFKVGLSIDDFALGELLRMRQGRVLFEQGEQGNEAYAVRSGEIGLEVFGRRLDSIYREGSIFGDYALMFQTTRTATGIVTSKEGADLLVLPSDAYYDQIRNAPPERVAEHIAFARKRMTENGLDTLPLRPEYEELVKSLVAQA